MSSQQVSVNLLITIIMIYAVDEEILKACDDIELKHSQVKTTKPLNNSYSSFKPKTSVSDSSRPGTLNAIAGSLSSASWSGAETRKPFEKRDVEPHTQTSRSSAVRRALNSLSFACRLFKYLPNLSAPVRSIMSKKLFRGVSASMSKKKTTRPVVLMGDSNVEDTLQLLTDTETASSFGASVPTTQDSLSSLGSVWERIEFVSSFRSPTAGGSGGSPSKSCKLSEEKASPSYTRGSSSSINTKPLVVKDVFDLDIQSSSSSPRNNGGASVIQPFHLEPTPPDGDAVLKNFLASPLGQDLDPRIIAHDKEIVGLMDRNKISWGVQYEIARGVTEGNWTWADVKAKIPRLHGSNSETAWKVRSIILDKTQPPSTSGCSVWQELDREQDAILEKKGRGLGPMGLKDSGNDWYGGRIQQVAELVGDKGRYRIRLEPMENKRSYRLARFLGSRRILQVKIPRDLIFKENKQLKEFMRHKFMLCGRVFVPFFAKARAVYLVETTEDHERQPADWAGDQFRRSFKDIVNWHNPLHLNADQPITKYATRFALAFATSIPVLQFKPENISIEPDTTDTWLGPGKPPAEYIKTDGCGLINEAALKIIARILDYLGYPVAIQGHPLGVLKEGEVYYRSSVAIVNSETQDVFNVLTGNVLLWRYPVRLASDIQKVMAVDRPELSRWVDVLIVSTKGEKSFASMLSGGDYDGDEVFILFLSSLLEHFKNKPVKPIPPNFKDNFQKYPEREAQEAFGDILMSDIDDSKFGLYSNWQEYAIWKYGYEDPRSAYIFNALLDSNKTGDRLKPGIFEQDQKQFSKPIPEFRMSDVEKPYIFHTLQRAGKAAGDELLREYDELEGVTQIAGDKVLLQPYNLAAGRALKLCDQLEKAGRLTLCEELKSIRGCVDKAHDDYKTVMTKLAQESKSASSKKKTTSRSKKIQRKLDPLAHVYELYNCQVEDVFFFQNVDEIKASTPTSSSLVSLLTLPSENSAP
ncbi:putative RNA-dependent RNA polymerase SHL2 [Termitomyces sp. T112]|nr:putative RNA-dependent RNA polymerase SHL2 [Termitomyces sp. T112]